MLTDSSLLMNPLLPRALVLGILGGVGLSLTSTFSRRGPMILPVYAAVFAALALVAARYADVAYLPRSIAIFAGYAVASLELYVAVMILADRDRQRSVAQGRLPASALHDRIPLGGHAWRLAALAGVGVVLSAAVAFIAG